jgi:hypothetical protein
MLTVEHLRSVYQGVHFGLAQNLRLELRRQVDGLFDDVDLLVTPTTPTGPFELTEEKLGGVGQHQGMSGVLNTCPLDLTGHPAPSVPSGIGEHDLPTALQIIGPGSVRRASTRLASPSRRPSVRCRRSDHYVLQRPQRRPAGRLWGRGGA